MKLRYKTLLLLLATIVIVSYILSFQTYTYPSNEEIDKRLNYLERVINEPLDYDSEIMLLGIESDEFMLFSYAFSIYALTNLAVTDSSYNQRACLLIKESISKSLDSKIFSTYGVDEQILTVDSLPDYSVLYLGHLNLMIGCYRLLSEDDSFNPLNDKISKSLFDRYNRVNYLCLESYPSSIWIPDNTVALASLKLHSANTGSRYSSLCDQWVEYAKQHFIHEKTGVLYSTIDTATGIPSEEPRGSMLGWSIMFIYQFDSEFAIDLYNNYKKHFSNNLGALQLFKERYKSIDTNMGDIDSGPIFLGYSIPANEFSLGGAVIAEDYTTAKKIERLINIGANKIEKDNELRYKVRFVNMEISPMAEALVLNSLTITKWVD